MPERAMQDLEILIHQENAMEVRRRLTKASFKFRGELTICGSSWSSPEQKQVDIVERSDMWLDQALIEAQQNLDKQGLPLLPLPYLVLIKFQAGRLQDLADISRMLGQANEKKLASVRKLFVQLLPGELEDLKSLITLGQLEMKG